MNGATIGYNNIITPKTDTSIHKSLSCVLISNQSVSTIAKHMHIGKIFAIAAAVAMGMVAFASSQTTQQAYALIAAN